MVTEKVDVWALGLIVHKILTGEELFTVVSDAGGDAEFMRRLAGSTAEVEAMVEAALSASALLKHPTAQSIVRGMLHAEPERRASLREVLGSKFFQAKTVTRVGNQLVLEVLAVFASPAEGYDPKAAAWMPLSNSERLKLDQEQKTLQESPIPHRKREYLTLGRLSDIEDAIRGRHGKSGFSPRVLQISAHMYEDGSIAFVNATNGRVVWETPERVLGMLTNLKADGKLEHLEVRASEPCACCRRALCLLQASPVRAASEPCALCAPSADSTPCPLLPRPPPSLLITTPTLLPLLYLASSHYPAPLTPPLSSPPFVRSASTSTAAHPSAATIASAPACSSPCLLSKSSAIPPRSTTRRRATSAPGSTGH